MTEPKTGRPIVDGGLPPELTEHERVTHNQAWISRQVEALSSLVKSSAEEIVHGISEKLLTTEAHGHSLEERIASIERLLVLVSEQTSATRAGVERIITLLNPSQAEG